MILSSSDMMSIVRGQLAVDLNCSPDDFDKDGLVFCEAKENAGRRPFPRGELHFDMLTMGRAVIVSATSNILPYLKEQLKGKGRDDAFSMPFIYGQGMFYLPDAPRPLPLRDDFAFEFIEQPDIEKYYALEGFHNAMQYDMGHPRPDILLMTAKRDGLVVGMAGASADCEMLWQIGIDVLPPYRNLGLAAALTNRLALEILERGKIPYYGTASSNIASQCVAHRAGLRPAWTCVWRGVFDGVLTAPTS